MKRAFLFTMILLMTGFIPGMLFASEGASGGLAYPLTLEAYHDSNLTELGAILKNRIEQEPLNLIVSLIFLFAIIHTFLAGKFLAIAHDFARKHAAKMEGKDPNVEKYSGEAIEEVSFGAELFHFLGEIEVVFGLWTLALLGAISYFHGWGSAVAYVRSVNFTEPMFVVVIMALAATRPVMQLAEQCMKALASLGGGTTAAWWVAILTLGPLLGSFITEPAAMTICALLLGKHFYSRKPSLKFAYATLGLLFVNISVGGTLSHFAAPPVLMVAGAWGWDFAFMATNFGWKAVIGIIIANSLYFMIFRGEFSKLQEPISTNASDPVDWNERTESVPVWITVAHLFFMLWTVMNAHDPALFIGGFLFFLGFLQATAHHQNRLDLKPAMLVGFFLAGLVTHGGVQSWWIAPILGSLGEVPLMLGATTLTAFNDNAAITYLSTFVPTFTDSLKYAVVAGAVTGGGLTVIANAPNPAGQSILQKYFPGGVSPVNLALSALIPTIIMGLCFMLLR
ncbi:MAG: hypothetical protein COB67_01540 [SAR324 cluster bacterium]|uniref:Na+/H+ antiporter n=1 Tax=SAR324 cluster bacterium TaxID=2024889 RepID=A0A2A4TAV9_9DELT|nr:MAG: hypothetical protein COB67_01540 [SAR324 cluster bacterium]